MRSVFAPEDLDVGMFIIKCDVPNPIIDFNSARCSVYKIVYLNVAGLSTKYGLCSVLTDGCCFAMQTDKKDLCYMLNNDPFGFRPITKQEMLILMEHNNQNFYWKTNE